MENDFWVIGDVAGEYDALMRLIAKLPKDPNKDLKLIFVGDLCDRGPKTKEVIEWVKNSGHIALMGNHEHMFIDYIMSRHDRDYNPIYELDSYCHLGNGGMQTLISYLGEDYNSWRPSKKHAKVLEHIEWLKQRPVMYELDDVVITHAPMRYGDIERFKNASLDDQVWNRDWIGYNTKFQFFGHNGKYQEYYRSVAGNLEEHEVLYAICVDDSRNGYLTAVHWPSLEKIQEKY